MYCEMCDKTYSLAYKWMHLKTKKHQNKKMYLSKFIIHNIKPHSLLSVTILQIRLKRQHVYLVQYYLSYSYAEDLKKLTKSQLMKSLLKQDKSTTKLEQYLKKTVPAPSQSIKTEY